MAKILTDGETSVGAYMFPDRKKPCLCVSRGNTIVVYGHFVDADRADDFMDELGKLVHAKMDGDE